MKRSFSKKEAISYAWKETKQNFYFFFKLLLLLLAFQIVPRILSTTVQNQSGETSLFSFLISLLSFLLQLIVGMGLIKIALEIHDNKKARFQDLFSCTHLILKYIIASFLYGLIVGVGILLLIVPGIIWAIKFQYFGYFIVDRELGPIEALKKSAAITNGAKWNLLFFRILLGLINMLGALALLVGLFWTIPTVMLSQVFVYRKLIGETKKSVTKTSTYARKKTPTRKKSAKKT